MTFILVLVYAAIAIFLIWWALRGAKKLDVDHGQHAHEAPHGQHEETRSATPQCSGVPRPCSPTKPTAWESSTITRAS